MPPTRKAGPPAAFSRTFDCPIGERADFGPYAVKGCFLSISAWVPGPRPAGPGERAFGDLLPDSPDYPRFGVKVGPVRPDYPDVSLRREAAERHFERALGLWRRRVKRPSGRLLLSGSGSGCLDRFHGVGRLDDLALDVDLDLVADHELAVENGVEAHPEFLAVDLRLGRVADAVSHRRVVELAVLHDVQRHRLGPALDGQVARHAGAVTARVLDLGALERHGRELVDLEEVGRPEVVVPGLVMSPDARGVDRRLDLRLVRMVRIDVAGRGDLGEVAAHRHHAEMLGRELNLCVIGIELPNRHRTNLLNNYPQGYTTGNLMETPFISTPNLHSAPA